MRKLLTMTLAALVAGAVLSADPRPVQARKEYLDCFVAKYESVADLAKEQKCLVCHGKKQKAQRSDYAKALEKALGEKMVKDKDKIGKALDSVAAQQYADGKTYGDLLKDGKLPAPFAE